MKEKKNSQFELPPEFAAPFRELSKDIKAASIDLNQRDGRFLVDMYYLIQDQRIRAAAQHRTSSEFGEPNKLLDWTFKAMETLENAIKLSLGHFAKSYIVGQWMQAQCGIGPVLSAAMLVNFDIRQAPAAGHFFSFAGLSPHIVWEKGKKRPYNAQLKAICAFRMGECFVRTSGNAKSVYGKFYSEYKVALSARNEAGELKDHAAGEIARCEKDKRLLATMKTKPRWKDWEAGKLCPQHIHEWSRRAAVKLFLSHLHQVMYEDWHGTPAPDPYVIAHGDGKHVHKIEPPLWAGVKYEGRKLKELLG